MAGASIQGTFNKNKKTKAAVQTTFATAVFQTEQVCSFSSKKHAFLILHLNEASNIRLWAVTLSPFVRLRNTQGSMAPCDLIFEHTAFCRRLNMQGG